jgi:hypothetical protein
MKFSLEGVKRLSDVTGEYGGFPLSARADPAECQKTYRTTIECMCGEGATGMSG